jgi:CDP-diacylglycerol--glycerol-3-phosphate 3-phosphatidyltransferase
LRYLVDFDRPEEDPDLIDIKFKHLFYVSNLLSILRFFFLIPIFYYLSKTGTYADIMVLVCIAVAALTDVFDGYFARLLNQKTDLGKILDPLADKIIIVVGMLGLVIHRGFPLTLVVFLGYRDLMILIGGLLIAKRSSEIIESNFWGKANTFMAATTAFVFVLSDGWWGAYILMVLTYLSILFSGTAYMFRGFERLQVNIGMRFLWGIIFLIPVFLIFYLTPGHLLGMD